LGFWFFLERRNKKYEKGSGAVVKIVKIGCFAAAECARLKLGAGF